MLSMFPLYYNTAQNSLSYQFNNLYYLHFLFDFPRKTSYTISKVKQKPTPLYKIR